MDKNLSLDDLRWMLANEPNPAQREALKELIRQQVHRERQNHGIRWGDKTVRTHVFPPMPPPPGFNPFRITIDDDRSLMDDNGTFTPPTKKVQPTMNMNTMAALVRDDVTTISVSRGNGTYTYLCSAALAKTLTEGESSVVVQGARGNDFAVAKVASIHDEPECDPEDGLDYKWVVAKVDTSHVDEMLRINDEIASRLQNRKKASRREQALAALGVSDPSKFLLDLKEQIKTD